MQNCRNRLSCTYRVWQASMQICRSCVPAHTEYGRCVCIVSENAYPHIQSMAIEYAKARKLRASYIQSMTAEYAKLWNSRAPYIQSMASKYAKARKLRAPYIQSMASKYAKAQKSNAFHIQMLHRILNNKKPCISRAWCPGEDSDARQR